MHLFAFQEIYLFIVIKNLPLPSFSYISTSDYVYPSSEIMFIKVNAKLTISYMVNKLLNF